jgi:hypothetical protein
LNHTVCLQDEIESKRQEMIELGMTKGFDHPDTIKVSQELDILIIKAMKAQG